MFGTGANTNGEGQWTWELTDVNKALEIKAPDNCGGAASGLPMMGDATEKTVLGDTTMYKTASTLNDVVDFYKKQMEAAGWTLEGEPTNVESMAMLNFTQGGKKASVTMTSDSGATQVIINVTGE